jgi:hypothetical protein
MVKVLVLDYVLIGLLLDEGFDLEGEKGDLTDHFTTELHVVDDLDCPDAQGLVLYDDVIDQGITGQLPQHAQTVLLSPTGPQLIVCILLLVHLIIRVDLPLHLLLFTQLLEIL